MIIARNLHLAFVSMGDTFMKLHMNVLHNNGHTFYMKHFNVLTKTWRGSENVMYDKFNLIGICNNGIHGNACINCTVISL